MKIAMLLTLWGKKRQRRNGKDVKIVKKWEKYLG